MKVCGGGRLELRPVQARQNLLSNVEMYRPGVHAAYVSIDEGSVWKCYGVSGVVCEADVHRLGRKLLSFLGKLFLQYSRMFNGDKFNRLCRIYFKIAAVQSED